MRNCHWYHTTDQSINRGKSNHAGDYSHEPVLMLYQDGRDMLWERARYKLQRIHVPVLQNVQVVKETLLGEREREQTDRSCIENGG